MSNFRLYAIRRSWLKSIVKRWPESGPRIGDEVQSSVALGEADGERDGEKKRIYESVACSCSDG